jgi:TIR domain
MDDNESRPPSVFVSYSHDSPEHKRWVGEFASTLVENGIDVIFDQWDLGPGDDVPKFMEHGVTQVDRVLMICTDSYVRKVDDGKGGVGYEAMIVTGELVRDLGTSKFIPVIRQEPGSDLRPTCVSTRFHINLSVDQNFDEEFELLLRELHQAPAISKPPLGRNPFAKQPSGADTPVTLVKESTIPDISKLNHEVVG